MLEFSAFALITVFATVISLAAHGGPCWKPLSYALIGGILVAMVVTKLQVPMMYAIFVLDLKILRSNVSENCLSPDRVSHDYEGGVWSTPNQV
jgi:Cu/Ag efflux pump CusA